MELDLEALSFTVCHSSTPGSPLVLVQFGNGTQLSSAILLQASLKTQVTHHPGLQQLWSLLFYFLFFLECSQKTNPPHLSWKPGPYHICPCWSPFLHCDSWCVFIDLALIAKILTVSYFGLEVRWFVSFLLFWFGIFSQSIARVWSTFDPTSGVALPFQQLVLASPCDMDTDTVLYWVLHGNVHTVISTYPLEIGSKIPQWILETSDSTEPYINGISFLL